MESCSTDVGDRPTCARLATFALVILNMWVYIIYQRASMGAVFALASTDQFIVRRNLRILSLALECKIGTASEGLLNFELPFPICSKAPTSKQVYRLHKDQIVNR